MQIVQISSSLREIGWLSPLGFSRSPAAAFSCIHARTHLLRSSLLHRPEPPSTPRSSNDRTRKRTFPHSQLDDAPESSPTINLLLFSTLTHHIPATNASLSLLSFVFSFTSPSSLIRTASYPRKFNSFPRLFPTLWFSFSLDYNRIFLVIFFVWLENTGLPTGACDFVSSTSRLPHKSDIKKSITSQD